MWIFTTKGFISVVAWKGCARTFCVRARDANHLRDLFPDHPIIEWTGADYPYRIRIKRGELNRLIASEIRAIHYPDFKSQLADAAYHDACARVWQTMHSLQDPRRRLWDDPLAGIDITYGTEPTDDLPPDLIKDWRLPLDDD